MSKKIEVDPKFAGSGQSLRRNRRRRARRKMALLGLAGVAGFAVVCLVIWGGVSLLQMRGDEVIAQDGAQTDTPDEITQDTDAAFAEDDTDGLDLVQSEGSSEAGIILQAAAAEAFLDIRGAPMIIVLPEGPAQGTRRIVLPTQIHPQRARQGDEVKVIDDVLLDASQQVQLTLPSSSADLAAFQARRASALVEDASVALPDTTEEDAVASGVEVTLEEDGGSWGEVVGDDTGEQVDGTVSYIETVIENTTTDVPATEGARRQTLFRDILVRIEQPSKLEAILTGEGLTPGEVTRITEFTSRTAARLELDTSDVLSIKKGGLVALRLAAPVLPDARLMQMSLYAPDRYLLSIAQSGPGRFEQSADPWYTDDLLRKAERADRARTRKDGEVRVKDAVYSAALRNGLPSELVGELMVMLSRVQDLDRIAGQNDRMRIVIAQDDRARTPAGQILYAALRVGDTTFECYVMQPSRAKDAPYGCYDPAAPSARGGQTAGALGAGYLIPVAGTKTSNFGPRHHPILKKTVNHNGVDWAAPTGTPVKATAGGTISRADVSPSYGNIIYVDHASAAQSRYAHLNKFADGIRKGVRVEAGQVIGYVGTTGRSTGPHLHFELRIGGKAVDPLALGAARASGAVEALVAQIIKVESAGNARAKNSRSSATGLGQFISSTWIRMMQTYRPDLVKRLNRQQLLDLRFDPALSRAMVTNLARENEAFLRARGHAITPGRLYLAHFLGPAGANIALRANPQASVLEVMGAGVVNANPFLKGRNVAWMTNWSDRKMGRIRKGASTAVASAPAAPQVEPAEVKRYKAGVRALLEAL